MSNSNMIAIYSEVSTNTKPRYGYLERDASVMMGASEDPLQASKVEPMRMTKHVLSVGAINHESLERKFPTLYPHLNIHEIRELGEHRGKVQADVCVHLDPMISEVLDIRLNIATQTLESKYSKDIRMWSRARDTEAGRRKAFNDLPWYKKVWRVLSCAVYRVECV